MIGFVMRRLRGRWPLAAAVLLTALITTTVLTALLAFTRTVGEAGLRQALQGPGRARSAVVVTGDRPQSARAKDDRAVRTFAADLFGDRRVGIESLARSRSYGLPGEHAPGKDADLTVLAALDPGRVRLVAGRLPKPAAGADGRIQLAVPQTTLARLGLTAGALPAEVRLDDRFGGPPLTVLVTGVYRAAEPDAPYWRLDPLGGREMRVGAFTTYGPLLVDDSVFTSGGLPQNGRSSLLTPDLDGLRPAEAAAMRERATGLQAGLQTSSALQSQTELPEFLAALESGQVVARSSLLVGALQLAVLASAALLLVAHLLTERQEFERVLLTARGASRRRLGALTATESVLLALPAAVLAPLFTPPLLGLLGRVGPLARVPLGDTSGTWLLWPVAAGCALVCVLLTTLPSVLRGATAGALRLAGRRQALVGSAARSGADLALVALAFLAYRQLDRYSGEGGVPAGGAGRLGVDPVLVAAPTLALCAGTLLVLRLLPFAARLGGRIAARGRGLGPALAGWQLARRPGRATGPVLLLVLAVSSGVLALGQHTAWSGSQRDQADFATAGGLRISESELAPLGRGGRYAALPGGERVLPVIRSRQDLPDGKAGQLLALDAAAVAERVPLREDLRDGRPMKRLFSPLAADTAGSPGASGIPLPGAPRRIDLDVTVQRTGDGSGPRLGLLLRDRFGLTYQMPMVRLPDSGDATAAFNVGALVDAPVGSAAPPLSIAGVLVSHNTSSGNAGQLAVRGISVTRDGSGPAVPLRVTAPAWTLSAPARSGSGASPNGILLPDDQDRQDASGGAPPLLRLGYNGGAGSEVAVTTGGAGAADVPGIATHAYLDAVDAKVGDVVPVTLAGTSVPVRITAAVGSLPAAGDTAVAVDAATAGRLLAARGGLELPPPDEWWLPAASAHDRAPAEAAAELRAGARTQRVELREEVAAGLLDDPLSAGPQAALAALALACAVLAAIGFAASAAAAARERGREFAILLALGAPRRDLARTAAAESGVLVGLGAGVGLALGAAIVHLVVPLVVLTPAARRPVPEVLVDLPAGETLLLTAAIAAVPLLSAVLGSTRNRNVMNTAARLRHVEEM
ncbi:FtsX-like permease family protein [Streptomyces sp. ADI91-18]|uniref:FtsX-like permease family protein n=1 Tax=Streptomyces sp. ADI91-18 TaxID=1522755 RepID=UPI000F5502B5|nr:FtsX-like permease family protein [Streptomyces sp. ADI91-18]RPK39777.1 FtsX-like permease family protein [Streptomyces sp. ADI91-18]